MFIILLTYKKEIVELERHLEGCRVYLKSYYQAGDFICSGRRNPRTRQADHAPGGISRS